MSRTVCVTIFKTITLEDDKYKSMSDDEIYDMFNEDVENYSLDDWRWDDESVTLEVKDTSDVILGGNL